MAIAVRARTSQRPQNGAAVACPAGHHTKESVLHSDIHATGRQVRDLGDNAFIKVSAKRGCWSCVMQLYVKLIPLWAGTSESAGEPRLLCCPPDVEPDTVLSFLTQQLGEVIDTA